MPRFDKKNRGQLKVTTFPPLRTFCHQIHQCAKIGGGPSNQFWQCHDLESSYSWSSSLMILVSYLITWSHLYVHKAWQRLHSSCLAIYFPICEYKAEMCGALRGFCLSEEAEIIAFLLFTCVSVHLCHIILVWCSLLLVKNVFERKIYILNSQSQIWRHDMFSWRRRHVLPRSGSDSRPAHQGLWYSLISMVRL